MIARLSHTPDANFLTLEVWHLHEDSPASVFNAAANRLTESTFAGMYNILESEDAAFGTIFLAFAK